VAGGRRRSLLLPGGWLFPGRNPVEPLSARQFNRAILWSSLTLSTLNHTPTFCEAETKNEFREAFNPLSTLLFGVGGFSQKQGWYFLSIARVDTARLPIYPYDCDAAGTTL